LKGATAPAAGGTALALRLARWAWAGQRVPGGADRRPS